MNSSQNIPSYILEYSNFSFYIRPEPENTGDREEIIKSISITSSLNHEHVIINGNSIAGTYKDVFVLGQNQLKTVRRQDKQIKQYSSIKDMPNDNTEDCFYFKPPSALDMTIQFTINIIYDVKITTSSGDDQSGSGQTSVQWVKDQSYFKTYSTVIKGSWDVWAKGFREYLKRNKT